LGCYPKAGYLTRKTPLSILPAYEIIALTKLLADQGDLNRLLTIITYPLDSAIWGARYGLRLAVDFQIRSHGDQAVVAHLVGMVCGAAPDGANRPIAFGSLTWSKV
jgi:hypothetical protein